MSIRQATDPVLVRDVVLEQSDERDTWMRRLLGAWADGYRAAKLAHADDYNRGYHDGAMSLKRAQHQAHDLAELDVRRWGPGGREHFADPRPGDYPGGTLPLERPGQIWLAGPVVHYHECTAVCRAIKPGWYKVPDTQDGAS